MRVKVTVKLGGYPRATASKPQLRICDRTTAKSLRRPSGSSGLCAPSLEPSKRKRPAADGIGSKMAYSSSLVFARTGRMGPRHACASQQMSEHPHAAIAQTRSRDRWAAYLLVSRKESTDPSMVSLLINCYCQLRVGSSAAYLQLQGCSSIAHSARMYTRTKALHRTTRNGKS